MTNTNDQDDIFNDDKNKKPTNPEGTPSTSQSDPFVDLLSGITNENGEPKYKSVEDALKALAHSQQFIKTLQTEKQDVESQLQTVRTELDKMGSIEDFINRIAPNAEPKKTDPTGEPSKGLSEEDITKLLENHLSKREQENSARENLAKVIGEVSKLHGDNAANVIAQRAKELNTTTDSLRELAKTNPSMALALLQVQPNKPVQSSQSSMNLPHKPTPENEPPKFERSAARGGLTNQQLVERWKEVGKYTHKRLNVEN